MRVVGQIYESEVPLQPAWLEGGDPAAIAREFHRTHARIYDFDDPDGRIEIVTLRLSAIGAGPALAFPEVAETDGLAKPEREIDVHTGGVRKPVGLYRRADLQPGSRFAGPAVVAQEDTTVAIPAGASARIDSHLNLHLSFAE
jgi:N-methylhydantoinase A